jgi:hypothetical protein
LDSLAFLHITSILYSYSRGPSTSGTNNKQTGTIPKRQNGLVAFYINLAYHFGIVNVNLNNNTTLSFNTNNIRS